MIKCKCRYCGAELETENPQQVALEGTKHLMKYHKDKFNEFMKKQAEMFNLYFEVNEVKHA